MPPPSIAILGGGLTGISAAFHLSRRFPTTKIVLLEKQARLGGWVRSETVELPQIHASVVLEAGPRTLRPNSMSVLELINLLQLQDKVITVPKTAPPAKTRFLYIPDSSGISGLQRLPSSLLSLLSSPLLSILLPSVVRELFKGRNRQPTLTDENVDSFLSRRFGESFAHIFGSALVHGIYATDSRRLSIRAAFPALWDAEERGEGSVFRGFLRLGKRKTEDVGNYELGNTLEMMKNVSVYSFKNGMDTLTKALEDHLRSTTNVDIRTDVEISRVERMENQSYEISQLSGDSFQTTHVVSALPLQILHGLFAQSNLLRKIPHLTENPTSSVHVINLVFPHPPKDIHPEGFGYLIPRPADGYPASYDLSSPGILGVVFDSCSLHQQDRPSTGDYYNMASHTKLTIMAGGPYPCLPLPPNLASQEQRQKAQGLPPYIRSLLAHLAVHLERKLPDPVYWRIWNNKACIPTLLPGHLQRMKEVDAVLDPPPTSSRHSLDGRLAIIGAGVGGVSVADCVEAGRRVGKQWV